MESKTNVLIVEDQAMPRQLFESIVSGIEGLRLSLSIDNAEIADICCKRHDIGLVIMDVVTKGGASGLLASQRIKKDNPKVKIIVATSVLECSYIERARKIGIEGFWYKDFGEEPFASVIKRVLAGEIVYPDKKPEVSLGLAKGSDLTKRELEILREMTGGYTNAEIASKEGLSEKRVRNVVASMLEKTGFRNRTELAVRARESGIVILERSSEDI